MVLTKEQIDIINSNGNIKINAVAGSGKTTTIIEYAKSRPVTSKILYLAFNKSVRLEAQKRFEQYNLHNLSIETAHSLAYKHIVPRYNYKIKQNAYKTYEIAELLGLKGSDELHAEYIIANHINKFITYYCNSNKSKVKELNYLDVVEDNKAKVFVNNYYSYIENQTRLLLFKMDKGEIDITHDFYLKKFQLQFPVLNYDYILFDEGQDASEAMLDVFLKQDCIKVIVGDSNQQIYRWRYAVNSLEKVDYPAFKLTESFRFGQDIAKLAMNILEMKSHIGIEQNYIISGNGTSQNIESKAVIARTNLGLLLNAIEYIKNNPKIKRIFFEGNINSYTYADEGTSLYDVLNLYNNKKNDIRDKLIKSMKSTKDLEEYIKKTDDKQLSMMLEIVKKYRNQIYDIIRNLKDIHVENDEKDTAEIIFSTVHKSKGMEYDSVQLVDDYISEDTLRNSNLDDSSEFNADKLNEEINLLYVAITRAKSLVKIPESLLPNDFPPSNNIKTIKKADSRNVSSEYNKSIPKLKFEKSNKMAEAKIHFKSAYLPWTDILDEELIEKYEHGISIKTLSKHFGRSKGAILSRIRKISEDTFYED